MGLGVAVKMGSGRVEGQCDDGFCSVQNLGLRGRGADTTMASFPQGILGS